MPKYAEGTVSPSGKFVVQGGKWVPKEGPSAVSGPPTTGEGFMAQAESLPQGDPERERALNMAVRLREPGAAGTAVGMTAALPAVASPMGLGLLKDAALYGAAETGEKVLGLPSWTGEAIGAISPAKQIGKLLLGGLLGGGKRAATGAVAEEAAKKAAAAAEKRAALEAEKVAVRKKSLEIAERRLALAEQKAAQQASKVAPKPKPVAEPAPVAPSGPDATIPASAGVTAPAAPLAPEVETQLVSMARHLRRTSPKERTALNEWLKNQPPEVAARLRELLAEGVDTMATNLGGKAALRPSMATGPGYELARLLGQVQ